MCVQKCEERKAERMWAGEMREKDENENGNENEKMKKSEVKKVQNVQYQGFARGHPPYY